MKKVFGLMFLLSSSLAHSMLTPSSEVLQPRIEQLQTRLTQAKQAGDARQTSRLLLRLGQLHFHLQNYTKATEYIDELLALSNANQRDKLRAQRLQQLIAQKA